MRTFLNAATLTLLIALSSSAAHAAEAMRASDFLDSLGVSAHMVQGQDAETDVLAGLRYTGIRNLREDFTSDPAKQAALCQLHAGTGVKISALPQGGNVAASLGYWDALAACGALGQVEGPNEPNNFSFWYQGVKCGGYPNPSYQACAAFQRDLYAAVKGDSALASVPVLQQSEPGAETDDQGLQFLTVPVGTLQPTGTVYADVANMHNYVEGNGSFGLTDNRAWDAEWNGSFTQSFTAFDGLYGEYLGITWRRHFPAALVSDGPALPKQTTETGWQTAPACGGLDGDQQGKLFVALYLSAAKLGWQKTFIYQMFDEVADGSYFGLFRQNHRTPKLSARDIHNLTAVLADSGSSFAPGSLSYSVVGETGTIHDLLLEKSDGTFEVVVWGDRQASLTSTNVQMRLPRSYPVVNVYEITGNAPKVRFANRGVVSLNVIDQTFVVELPAV